MSACATVIVDRQPGDVLVERGGCVVVVAEVERTNVVVAGGPQGVPGPPGRDGSPGLRVTGAVPDEALLPTTAEVGEVWVTRSDGHGHTFTNSGWVDIGPIAIQGPAGVPGKDGQIRYTGHGAPGVIVGAEPGDTYLDLLSGEIYKLL